MTGVDGSGVPATTVAVATDLARTWGSGTGLAPVSFTLSVGELVVVRGRSGSGKSTLLALLAGWIEPDGGRLDRAGPWSGGVARTWAGTSILPQVIAPIAELTTLENVALPLRLGGSSWAEAKARARPLLRDLDLTDEAERAAVDASMGQQQRMALARAAIVAPVVLLADEPTSHQDGGHVASVLTSLRSLLAGGTCVVVATHDPTMVTAADRVLDLDALAGHA